MKVLMLKGKDNCGKTTTINRVRDILSKESQTIEMEPINKADFSCVLLYRGLKVGIYSEGDYSTKIINKMNEYAEKGCDVFVCACNEFKKPQNKIQIHEGSILINKTLCDISISKEEANEKDTNRIINIINQLFIQ